MCVCVCLCELKSIDSAEPYATVGHENIHPIQAVWLAGNLNRWGRLLFFNEQK